MTKISNQEKYVPDLRISELDSVIGTDYDDNDKTVNFRVRELAEFINRFNGNSGLDFVFFFRQDESLSEPNSGYFYSELNVSNPINITKLYFSKTTSSGFDVSKVFNFLQSNSSDYLLKIANTSDPNKFFYLNISSIVNNTTYYTINVSLKGTPVGILLESNTTHTIFIEQKSSSVTIESTSELINNGSDNTSTYVENDELGAVATSNDYNDLDNLPTIPTVITNHSGLTLDDGTNPHGTTKTDVGLGNVDNTSDLNKPISTATQTALDSKQDTLVSGTNIKTINGDSLLGSGDLIVSGGKKSIIIEIPISQSIAASTSWYSRNTITQNIFTATFTTNASLTPTNDFANHVAQTPCNIIPFDCKIKNVVVRGHTNSAPTDVRFVIIKSDRMTTNQSLIVNPDIIADKTVATNSPVANVYSAIFSGADLDTTVTVPQGGEIRLLLFNNNVASNLYTTSCTIELEEI